ncbi:TPA: hypothetical protein ACOBUB_000152 [Enterococcus faecium]
MSELTRIIYNKIISKEDVLNYEFELNKEQKIILDRLEAKDSDACPMEAIVYLWDCIRSNRLGAEELTALKKLTGTEQFEVLAVFAQRGLRRKRDD